jgi:hypothetical protein
MKRILHKTAMTDDLSSKPIASETLGGANVVLKILQAEIRSAEKRVARTTSLYSPTIGKDDRGSPRSRREGVHGFDEECFDKLAHWLLGRHGNV